MRIGALSALTGLSRDTLRYYERQGLIRSNPSDEPSNTYRDYPDDTAERLRMITDARDAGLSIADLKTLLDCMEHGELGAFDLDDFLETRIRHLDHIIATAERTRDVLLATKAAISPHADDLVSKHAHRQDVTSG
ncbi:MerR family transcriptional regulator [Yoonia sp. SS1-5]|uniref:MerR family transcriptional regulator n=1 Tax=Yoonia rhodophyticola TaxID=3137370 RepID=A0AAN0MDP2_9RHOB